MMSFLPSLKRRGNWIVEPRDGTEGAQLSKNSRVAREKALHNKGMEGEIEHARGGTEGIAIGGRLQGKHNSPIPRRQSRRSASHHLGKTALEKRQRVSRLMARALGLRASNGGKVVVRMKGPTHQTTLFVYPIEKKGGGQQKL